MATDTKGDDDGRHKERDDLPPLPQVYESDSVVEGFKGTVDQLESEGAEAASEEAEEETEGDDDTDA
ncbi:hypothetical protein ACQUSR_01995 [Streptomyces sp. P1-3]|uniref:hypothetical protein n=1 Tax=Streptomyces sp. P1-3 TaxID=3421658 RepID=UPI003D36153A